MCLFKKSRLPEGIHQPPPADSAQQQQGAQLWQISAGQWGTRSPPAIKELVPPKKSFIHSPCDHGVGWWVGAQRTLHTSLYQLAPENKTVERSQIEPVYEPAVSRKSSTGTLQGVPPHIVQEWPQISRTRPPVQPTKDFRARCDNIYGNQPLHFLWGEHNSGGW